MITGFFFGGATFSPFPCFMYTLVFFLIEKVIALLISKVYKGNMQDL